MYAVIQTGGKQYKVSQGDRITVERLQGEIGDKVSFEDVRFVSDPEESGSGASDTKGVTVSGTIVEQSKGDKILVFKFKRRKMYRRLTGHRQLQTSVLIDGIRLVDQTEKTVTTKTKKAKPKPKKAAEETDTQGTESSEK